jgi:hypothetical protein
MQNDILDGVQRKTKILAVSIGFNIFLINYYLIMQKVMIYK